MSKRKKQEKRMYVRSKLICSTCGKVMEEEGMRIITFLSKSTGNFLLKDFKLSHIGVCDYRERKHVKGWMNSWVATWSGSSGSKGVKEILANLVGYGPETQIEGKSLVRVLAQLYGIESDYEIEKG